MASRRLLESSAITRKVSTLRGFCLKTPKYTELTAADNDAIITNDLGFTRSPKRLGLISAKKGEKINEYVSNYQSGKLVLNNLQKTLFLIVL